MKNLKSTLPTLSFLSEVNSLKSRKYRFLPLKFFLKKLLILKILYSILAEAYLPLSHALNVLFVFFLLNCSFTKINKFNLAFIVIFIKGNSGNIRDEYHSFYKQFDDIIIDK